MARAKTSENSGDEEWDSRATKGSKLPLITVSNTYEERLETKECATKRKWKRRLRAGVRSGNNGFEVLRVMRKRAPRALSTKPKLVSGIFFF